MLKCYAYTCTICYLAEHDGIPHSHGSMPAASIVPTRTHANKYTGGGARGGARGRVAHTAAAEDTGGRGLRQGVRKDDARGESSDVVDVPLPLTAAL